MSFSVALTFEQSRYGAAHREIHAECPVPAGVYSIRHTYEAGVTSGIPPDFSQVRFRNDPAQKRLAAERQRR
jgi:hypothetical protein